LPPELHYTTWTAERTIAQLQEASESDKPFFCWSSFHDPHPPYLAPEPWVSMYDPDQMQPGQLIDEEHDLNPPHFGMTQEEKPDFSKVWPKDRWLHGTHSHRHTKEDMQKDMACYYGMVSFMDQQIGRILKKLDELGLTENTLVIFTTDHGHFLGQHGLTAKAIHHYEDLLRVPFLVRWPGKVAGNSVRESILNLVDLAPTFCAAAGVEIPTAMTGKNQLDTFCGGPSVRTGSITENHHGTYGCHMRTYVNQRYKITIHRYTTVGELFDLQQDPGETKNLWSDPDRQELKTDLLLEFHRAILDSEQMRMPRIAGA